jgi:glutamate synthase (NADPH/NADH) small chain
MGDIRGFMKFQREVATDRSVAERLKDWREIPGALSPEALQRQGARCMDCGVPFCHAGCPLGNIIPDFNDLAYRNDWEEAIRRLHATNNFPEFTGRVCPAPCETACVLAILAPPVAIKLIEHAIIDRAWEEGWIAPQLPARHTGKKVAVVGSGPAGLAAAQQLCRAGHAVTVFERDDRPGGLLMYGIPDFKLEKAHVWRRIRQMEAEGVKFVTGCRAGGDVTAAQLRADFDAILLAIGSTKARELPIPGRDLRGIHQAMDFLPQQNKVNQGDAVAGQIVATGKRVVIIGGGDTGSDCIGTSNRQGAASVVQVELLPKPVEDRRPDDQPWPFYPMYLRTSSSQEEGCERRWSILTKSFLGDGDGNVRALQCVRLEWARDEKGQMRMNEIPGSEFELAADLILLAMGFLGPEKDGLVEQLGLALDSRGNVAGDDNYMTNVPGVFSAGDCRRGQSLVVWALAEGREAARGVDQCLMGYSDLPTPKTRDESLPRR